MLSDIDIQQALKNEEIIIKDFDPQRLQPASYDVLLGNEFLLFDSHRLPYIDTKQPIAEYMTKITIPDDEYFILHPQEFALGVTFDYIGVNQSYSYELMGKSSLARLGLIIHTTAGFIDPGNQLNITLELFNANTLPIKLYPKMKIGQVAFTKLQSPASIGYGHPSLNSKYYGSTGVDASQYHKNFS